MSSFQENLRSVINNNALENSSLSPIRSNMYTRQNAIEGSYAPKDPTTSQNFIDNYRKTTAELGGIARAYKTSDGKYPNLDNETKEIMSRIKLPTYNDAISDLMRQSYKSMYSRDPQGTERAFNKASEEFDEDNFYYKLRAAQILKNQPEEVRESYLNNFNVSAYDAKNELDKLMASENKKTVEGINALKSLLKTGSNYVGNAINNVVSNIFGTKKQEETSGQEENTGALADLAERLGENNSFRLYSTKDYKSNGELTDEAKSRGPSSWNSETTNSDGSPKKENEEANNAGNIDDESVTSDDVIEYTYKPGDTFGQVISDMGLRSDKGLWGPDGDVEYYTKQVEKQLWESGVWPKGERQNIPVGTTIKLRRRQ